MREAVGDRGTVCRLGGDEFLVILPDAGSPDAAQELGRTLVRIVAADIPYGDNHITVGASVGLALAQHDSNKSDLLRQADIALYSAKAAGRGQIQTYQATPDTLEELERIDNPR